MQRAGHIADILPGQPTVSRRERLEDGQEGFGVARVLRGQPGNLRILGLPRTSLPGHNRLSSLPAPVTAGAGQTT
jgi:hypothetical protein